MHYVLCITFIMTCSSFINLFQLIKTIYTISPITEYMSCNTGCGVIIFFRFYKISLGLYLDQNIVSANAPLLPAVTETSSYSKC